MTGRFPRRQSAIFGLAALMAASLFANTALADTGPRNLVDVREIGA